MKTNFYKIQQSPIFIDGIKTLESYPPQCQIDFHIMVYWSGHKIISDIEKNGEQIKIYVTLVTPPRGPMKGVSLGHSVNIGELDSGEYQVLFYFRTKEGESEPSKFILSNSICVSAEQSQIMVSPSDLTNLYAWYNAGFVGSQSIHVTGTIKVKVANVAVNLIKAIPQGFNPNILLLDIELSKTDKHMKQEQEIHYSENAYIGLYSEVHIRFPNNQLKQVVNIEIIY